MEKNGGTVENNGENGGPLMALPATLTLVPKAEFHISTHMQLIEDDLNISNILIRVLTNLFCISLSQQCQVGSRFIGSLPIHPSGNAKVGKS